MSHFNLKSLAFYGIAITSVVVLFKVATAYGEKNLQAASPIGGSYRLNAEALPGCLKSESLVLTIKQSGTYLFGSLLPAKAKAQVVTSAAQKPSLSGRLEQPNLKLKGAIPQLTNCDSDLTQSSVQIQGTVNKDILNGYIKLSSSSEVAEFTATKEPPEEKLENKP
jgi:hypothetical protein